MRCMIAMGTRSVAKNFAKLRVEWPKLCCIDNSACDDLQPTWSARPAIKDPPVSLDSLVFHGKGLGQMHCTSYLVHLILFPLTAPTLPAMTTPPVWPPAKRQKWSGGVARVLLHQRRSTHIPAMRPPEAKPTRLSERLVARAWTS